MFSEFHFRFCKKIYNFKFENPQLEIVRLQVGQFSKIRGLAWQQLGRKGKVAYFKTSPKKLQPEAVVFVYLDKLTFFFGVDLERRCNVVCSYSYSENIQEN